jgi:hypothetical protein
MASSLCGSSCSISISIIAAQSIRTPWPGTQAAQNKYPLERTTETYLPRFSRSCLTRPPHFACLFRWRCKREAANEESSSLRVRNRNIWRALLYGLRLCQAIFFWFRRSRSSESRCLRTTVTSRISRKNSES